MYIPKHFEETRPEVLHGLIRDHALATIVVVGPAGLVANHVPLALWPDEGPKAALSVTSRAATTSTGSSRSIRRLRSTWHAI